MSIYEYDEEATRQAIRIEEYERGRAEGMKAFILDNIESGFTKEEILSKLIKRFGINEANAEAYYGEASAEAIL